MSDMQWQQEIFQQSKARLNADKLIGRSSLSSSCEDIESLLVEDEKEETPDEKDSLELCPKRRSGVIKAVLILIVLVAACGIIFLAAKGVFINPHSHPNSMSSTTSLYSLPNPSEYPDVDHGGRWQDAPDLSLFYAPHRTHGKDSSQTKYLLKDPCGHTAVEARARGCRFGVLNYAWLPEACFDEKMEEEFRTYTNWEFWSFPNKTAPVTWDEAAKGEHDLLFIEWEYHVQHCAGLARRFIGTVTNSDFLSIDSSLAQQGHQEHCTHTLMDRNRPLDEFGTILWRKFPDCGVTQWAKK